MTNFVEIGIWVFEMKILFSPNHKIKISEKIKSNFYLQEAAVFEKRIKVPDVHHLIISIHE